MDAEGGHGVVDRLRELNARNASKQKLSVGSVCSKLGLKEEEVVALFLIGSRLWGTAGEDSDWDFEVVLRKGNAEGKELWTLHGGNVDATCMSAACFARRMKEHAFMCLVTAWLPKEWVWKRVEKQMPSLGKLDKAALCKAVREEATRDWNVAQKKADKGVYDGAKKVVLHAIRMLRIAVEYAQTEKVPNLWCVDDIVELVNNTYGAVDLKALFGEEFDRLMAQLESVCKQ